MASHKYSGQRHYAKHMNTIYIRHEPIELYKILKFENLVYGGGEAKLAISGGYVLLNGEVETQKRKKIVSGDVIEFDQQLYKIELEPSAQTQQKEPSAQTQQKAPSAQTQQKAPEPQTITVKTPKRSAIKF